MKETSPTRRRAWPPIIARAKEIVEQYETEITLRGLFYRLVVDSGRWSAPLCPFQLGDDSVEMPVARCPLELVGPAVVKGDSRSDDGVLDGL